eukprot:scaffold117097_cov22-Tisochrysis_lutea.AAC.1
MASSARPSLRLSLRWSRCQSCTRRSLARCVPGAEPFKSHAWTDNIPMELQKRAHMIRRCHVSGAGLRQRILCVPGADLVQIAKHS